MILDLTDSRYNRQELIPWWDQERLASARVLLVGAGALGNEIGKNLALVGFGHVTVVDMDRIERSNLARCALFRDEDEGKLKAQMLAKRMKEVNPNITTDWFAGQIQDLGVGAFEDIDLAVAGLDSRIARLWVNRAARQMNRPWVDGAIEGIRGVARVFLPDGPCYECTLGENDRRVLDARRSCALLTPEQMLEGKVPTNATTASIIGGIEAQEAIKLLHDRPELPVLAGRAFMYSGETLDTYLVDYVEDEYCMSHERLGPRQRVSYSGTDTLRSIISNGGLLGEGEAPVVVELVQEIVRSGACATCGTLVTHGRSLRSFGTGDLVCPGCETPFGLDVATRFDLDDAICDQPLTTLGLARHDVAIVKEGDTWTTLLLSAQA